MSDKYAEMAGVHVAPSQFRPYQYEALPSATSIRIVKILGEDADNAICGVPLIRCQLQFAELESKPHYQALSYTWSSPLSPDHSEPTGGQQEASRKSAEVYRPSNQWPILLNEKLFFVRKNLYEFIRHVATIIEIEQPRPPYRKTAIIEEAERGNLARVKELLESGADLSKTDVFGETALHYAAENGYTDVVKELVRAGADTNRIDNSKRTPIQCAVQGKRRNWMEVVEFLNQDTPKEDRTGAARKPRQDLAIASASFWIDAICIDQENLNERNVQVSMMPRIYQSADSAVVWLGADPVSDIVYDLIDFAQTLQVGGANTLPGRLRPLLGRNDYIYVITVGGVYLRTNHLHGKHMELDGFLLRSWFQRSWIIQEIGLARKVTMWQGQRQWRWNDFVRLLHLIESAGLTRALKPHEADVKFAIGQRSTEPWILARIRLVVRRDKEEHDSLGIEMAPRQQEQQEQNLMSLPMLLALTWNFYCSDPRDKIFSLLSMAEPLTGEPGVVVDYRHPVEELYTRVAHHFLRGTGAESYTPDLRGLRVEARESVEPLEGLSFVHRYRRTDQTHPGVPNLPSWVPDFSSRLGTRLYNKRFTAASGVSQPEKATPPPGSVQDWSKLSVHAAAIDEVAHLEEKHTDGYEDIRSWLTFLSVLPQRYLNGEYVIEVLRQTFVADDSWVPDPKHQDPTDGFKEFLWWELVRLKHDDQAFEAALASLQVLLDKGTGDPSAAPALSAFLPTVEEVRGRGQPEKWCLSHGPVCFDNERPTFRETLFRTYRYRKLFATRAGYLGLCPMETEPGDAVHLLAGYRTPVVMRKKSPEQNGPGNERFTFVGEAYLHGIMRGEALTPEVETRFRDVELV